MKKTAIILTAIILVSSCNNSFFDLFNKNVSVKLTNVNGTSNQNLIYIDENFITQSIALNENNAKEVTLSLQKNRLTPILIYTSDTDSKPRGCIYPISTSIGNHTGFAAWILYRLLRGSYKDNISTHEYLSHFNWSRLCTYIEKYEDPWILNQDLILENIADRSFNVYSIKEK